MKKYFDDITMEQGHQNYRNFDAQFRYERSLCIYPYAILFSH